MLAESEPSRWKNCSRNHETLLFGGAKSHAIWAVVLFVTYLKQTVVFAQDNISTSHPYRYSVIVDCGSSGSRAHIFRWPAGPLPADHHLESLEPMRDEQTGKPLIRKVEPGLASFHNQPELASVYMKPIMDFLSAAIPRESQRETPIYFMATAGLRLLSRQERQAILDDITRDLKRDYNFSQIHTRIISGAQEGEYEWLSVNAHAKRLSQQPSSLGSFLNCKRPLSNRFGLLEMGGASIQVAFELTPELDRLLAARMKAHPAALNAYKHSQVELNMDSEGQRKVRLFSTTFLGLGSNSARDLAIDLLVRRSLPVSVKSREGLLVEEADVRKLELADPCLPTGASEISLKPMEILYDESRTIGYQTPDRAELEVTLKGTGNFGQCQRLVNQVLHLARSEQLNCHDNEESSAHFCPMHLLGVPFVPFKHVQFLGLGDLFHTTNEMLHTAGQLNLVVTRLRTSSICSTPYDQLIKRYPEATRVDPKRILHECFKANWMIAFLTAGLRLSWTISHQLETTNKVNGRDIDWTYGAALLLKAEQK